MKKNILIVVFVMLIGSQKAMDDTIVKPAPRKKVNIEYLEQSTQNSQSKPPLNPYKKTQYDFLRDFEKKFEGQKLQRLLDNEEEKLLRPLEVYIKNKDPRFVDDLSNQRLSLSQNSYVALYCWALKYGNKEVIRYFIKKNKKYKNTINPAVQKVTTRTCPLIIAHRNKQQEVIDLLLQEYNAELDLYINHIYKRK